MEKPGGLPCCQMPAPRLLAKHRLPDSNRTSLQTPTPGPEAEGLTPKLLRLKFYCSWAWGFFSFSFSLSVLLSSLCLSNACLAHCWLVHYLSPFISLALVFLWVCVCVCLFVLFCFPFFFTFFAFPLLSPFHSRYHHCYYYKVDNTKLHTVQGQ
jgi:hypothetical protein